MPYLGISPASTGSVTASNIADGSISTAKLADNAVTTAKITNGTIASGDLASGVGGKTLQVVQNFDDQYATYSNSSVDAQATVLSQAITPSATSSKILIEVRLSVSTTNSGNKHYGLNLYRGSTEIGKGDASSWNANVGVTHSAVKMHEYSQPDKILIGCFLDSPNTSSAVTYNVKGFIHDYGSSVVAKTLVVNGGGHSYNSKETAVTTSSITLTEIGA
jgi:hypothetical protein